MSQVEHILTKIEHLVLDANNTNTSDNPGKGTNDRRDYISMEDSKKWKYKDVFPKFKLKDGTPEFSYHLLNYNISDSLDNALIILPGFSSKSRDWTFGRINRFINEIENMKNYSDIIIFDFHEIKPLMKEEYFGENPMKNFYEENIDHVIAGHLHHILNKLGFNNYHLIGRSAGAGISIVLSSMNDKVSKLYLACPGWNEKGVEKLVQKFRNDKVFEIKIYHSIKDTYIHPEETEQLSVLLSKHDVKHSYEPLEIEEIDGNAFHHRIYEKLVKDLFK